MPARRIAPWQSDPRTWYQLERWRRLRRLQLSHNPLCALCLESGEVRPATVADHVVPHNGNWNQFLTGRLQSLCEQCHNSDKRYRDLHGRPRERVRIGVDGWPIEVAPHTVSWE